ncbi:MAG: MoaD/ThiS family protein, partial [Solirubrobacteraceae bacterium]
MSAAGTSAATAELALELEAGVEDVLDEVVVELLLLLLPQPTIAAAVSSATSAAARRLQELLKSQTPSRGILRSGPQFGQGYATNGVPDRSVNRLPIDQIGGQRAYADRRLPDSLNTMQVRVLLFAGLRERAGASTLELDLPE